MNRSVGFEANKTLKPTLILRHKGPRLSGIIKSLREQRRNSFSRASLLSRFKDD